MESIALDEQNVGLERAQLNADRSAPFVEAPAKLRTNVQISSARPALRRSAHVLARAEPAPDRAVRRADCWIVGGIPCTPPCSPRANRRRVTSPPNNGTPPVRSLTSTMVSPARA